MIASCSMACLEHSCFETDCTPSVTTRFTSAAKMAVWIEWVVWSMELKQVNSTIFANKVKVYFAFVNSNCLDN
jgi:hypothetical protein